MSVEKNTDICGQLILSLRAERKRLYVRDIVDTLKERAYGLLILLLTMPNGVPGPTIVGMSTILGLPVLFFTFEAATGRTTPRLPRFAGKMRMNRYKLIRHLDRIRPYILNVESMMKPRMEWVIKYQRLNYAICGIYGLFLTVPIPAGNLVSAWAIIFLSLGMIMRDGKSVLIGHAIGVAAIIWNLLIVFIGIEIIYWLADWFSQT